MTLAIDSVPAPEINSALTLPEPCPEAVRLMLYRRSVVAANLREPGPDGAQLKAVLTAGARVPDHGKLTPWRFVVFEGDARAAFGEVLASALRINEPNAPQERLAFETERFLRAPVVVAVISSPKESVKIPEWEQILSAGAVCQNMLITANALGFSGQWLTEWYAYDGAVCAALGLTDRERIAGFLYLGTATEAPKERARPELDTLVTRWQG